LCKNRIKTKTDAQINTLFIQLYGFCPNLNQSCKEADVFLL